MINQYSFNLDMPQDDYLCHDKLGAHEHIKNLRRLQSAHEDWAKAEKNTMERLSNPKTAGYTSSSNDRIKKSVNNIQSDRDKLSNKVRYDVETTAAKARSNISSTINKIKNKVLK